LRFAQVQNASGHLRRRGEGTHPENVDYLYTLIDSSDRGDTGFLIVHERIKLILIRNQTNSGQFWEFYNSCVR
jgi:hypothetical protein